MQRSGSVGLMLSAANSTPNDDGVDDSNCNNMLLTEAVLHHDFDCLEEGKESNVLDLEFGHIEEGKESNMEDSVNVTDDGDETSVYVPNTNKDKDFLLQLSDCSDDLIANTNHEKK